MIFKGSIEPSNFKLGSTQLSKICKGLATLWENWKDWEWHHSDSSFRDYSIHQYYDYTIPANVKVKYAYVASQTDGNNTGTWAALYGYNGSSWVEIVKTNQQNWDMSTSYSWNDGCPYSRIRFSVGGRSLRRKIFADLTGLQK